MELRNKKTGATVIEYAVLVVLIMMCLYLMKIYITRGVQGQWKNSGESFAFGRRFDHGRSARCTYEQINAQYGVWYETTCYHGLVDQCKPGNFACENNAKLQCKTKFCCEDNQEAPGASNCN